VRTLTAGLAAGLVLLLAGAFGGCAEQGPEPAPDQRETETPSLLDVDLELTFHRNEEPVQVSRPVSVPLEPGQVELAPEVHLEQALTALVHGPTPAEAEMGLTSFFSQETGDILRRAVVENGRAVVDFHDFRTLIPGASSSAGSLAFLAQLNGTVFAAVPVDEVEYRLEGSCEEFWAFLQRECTVVPRPQRS